MAKADPLRAVLGYHNIGEYFYFAVLHEGNQFFGQRSEDRFDTLPAFAGFVTAVHEHHHLMQELSQGLFWWHQMTRDLIVVQMIEAVKALPAGPLEIPLRRKSPENRLTIRVDTSDPVALVELFDLELETALRQWSSPQLTRSLLLNEVRVGHFERFINPEMLELTTLDLVECHAAILTELYVTKMMVEQPEKFDPRIVDKLSDLFRVDRMPHIYLRPLRALLHLMKTAGLEVRQEGASGHPLYERITHGLHYVTLAFLLDYALHLPPKPIELLNQVRDISTQQDIYPPFRFINLAFLYAIELKTNRSGRLDTLTREPLLYSQGSPALARMVNDMHAAVRGGRSAASLPETFFDLQETTRRWIKSLDGHPFEREFPLIDAVQTRAVRHRLQHPDHFLRLAPLDFGAAVKLPRVFLTARGLGTAPYWADDEQKSKAWTPEQLKAFLAEAMQVHYDGFQSQSPDRKAMARFPATLVPYPFIESWIGREMSFRYAKTLLHGDSLRCPLTESIGRYVPCRPRTPACEAIHQPSSLPASDCLMRETVTRLYGSPERFRRSTTEPESSPAAATTKSRLRSALRRILPW